MRTARNVGQQSLSFFVAAVIALSASMAPQCAQAAETKVVTGVIGTYAAGVWPLVIGMKKGLFAKRELTMDVIFVPSASGLIQQLTAGSLDFVAGVGVVEPLVAVEKGAPVALMRIVGQTPSYEMIGNKNIASLKDLKGKRISVGGLRTNDKVYLDHMMAANGLKDGDYDVIVIGATGARVPALQSGGIDAALFVPPFNFVASRLGGKSLGLVRDYVKDLPQTAMVIAKPWAAAHPEATRAINATIDEAVAWFYDPKNRDEAIALMVEASKAPQQEVADAYDFLVKIDFFAGNGTIKRGALTNWMKEMVALKDMKALVPIDALLVPGLNAVMD